MVTTRELGPDSQPTYDKGILRNDPTDRALGLPPLEVESLISLHYSSVNAIIRVLHSFGMLQTILTNVLWLNLKLTVSSTFVRFGKSAVVDACMLW
jgi:hypothetical protein